MVFHDLHSSTPSATPSAATPSTITDWQQVKAQLGFAVYLPATLAEGTCLVSASGTVNDPILGSSFTIGYLYPDHTSLSLTEGKQHTQNSDFQCNAATTAPSTPTKGSTPTPTPTSPVLLCSGIHDKTNIVLSGSGQTADLQKLFNALAANVDWVPA